MRHWYLLAQSMVTKPQSVSDQSRSGARFVAWGGPSPTQNLTAVDQWKMFWLGLAEATPLGGATPLGLGYTPHYPCRDGSRLGFSCAWPPAGSYGTRLRRQSFTLLPILRTFRERRAERRASNQTVQGTGASRFAQRQIERHRRLAPVGDLGRSAKEGESRHEP